MPLMSARRVDTSYDSSRAGLAVVLCARSESTVPSYSRTHFNTTKGANDAEDQITKLEVLAKPNSQGEG